MINMGIWYDSSKDGTIEEYIKYCKDERIPKTFKGDVQFQGLIKLGYILPEMTYLRIINEDRSDEFYRVTKEFNLEGMSLDFHSGKKGIHNSKEILSGDIDYFEVEMINPNPKK